MSSSTPTIRYATVEDVPAILELLREHATYEKHLQSLEATEETLAQTITFGSPDVAPTTSTNPARCLLLLNEAGAPAALTIYFYNYSSWRSRPGIYVEDLYVRESERKKGYGRRLLQAVAQEVVRTGGARLDWVVATWNQPSIRFYEKLGAEPQDQWMGMRVEHEALAQLAGL